MTYRKCIVKLWRTWRWSQCWSTAVPLSASENCVGDWSTTEQTWDEREKKTTFIRKRWWNTAARFGKCSRRQTGGFVSFIWQVGGGIKKDRIRCAKCLNRLLLTGRGRVSVLKSPLAWCLRMYKFGKSTTNTFYLISVYRLACCSRNSFKWNVGKNRRPK